MEELADEVFKDAMKNSIKSMRHVICVTYDYVGPYSSFSIRDFVKIGEWYEVLEEHDTYYTIDLAAENLVLNSSNPVWRGGYEANLSKSYFKTIDEIREEKLNGLCL